MVMRYFITDGYSSVFIPLYPRVLITHCHGPHKNWKPGQTVQVGHSCRARLGQWHMSTRLSVR